MYHQLILHVFAVTSSASDDSEFLDAIKTLSNFLSVAIFYYGQTIISIRKYRIGTSEIFKLVINI